MSASGTGSPGWPELQGGDDALLAGHPHAAGPEANLREPGVGRPGWRAATPRREEQEVGPLLVGVPEQTTAGIAPMLGLELIHAPTLEPHPTSCLIIPGTTSRRLVPLGSIGKGA